MTDTIIQQVLDLETQNAQKIADIQKSLNSLLKINGKKQKNQRDPNKPKKNISAYIFFSSSQRGEYSKKYPDLKNKDIQKKMGEDWKALSSTERKKYDDMAKNDQERYEKENQTYLKMVENSSSPPPNTPTSNETPCPKKQKSKQKKETKKTATKKEQPVKKEKVELDVSSDLDDLSISSS